MKIYSEQVALQIKTSNKDVKGIYTLSFLLCLFVIVISKFVYKTKEVIYVLFWTGDISESQYTITSRSYYTVTQNLHWFIQTYLNTTRIVSAKLYVKSTTVTYAWENIFFSSTPSSKLTELLSIWSKITTPQKENRT